MAKRGLNGQKLNGRPEFPPADNVNGLDMGQRVVFHEPQDGKTSVQAFRWSGRYFPGASRKAKEGRRLAAERRAERR